MPRLAEKYDVIAPDLLGHGKSAKPHGDYSLGAYASGVRDLLVALDVPKATIVGHSLGGGIALQYAYQFPDRVGRMVLVDTGGIDKEVNLVLRAATLPGAEIVLPVLFAAPLHEAALKLRGLLNAIGLQASADVQGVSEGFSSLTKADARRAFLHTVRSVIDPSGQKVSAKDRLYLAADIPSLIVWGERDHIIPSSHGQLAHELMPNSRLEIFLGAGHFPFNDDPDRFIKVLNEFIESTEEADLDEAEVRRLLNENDNRTKALKK